MYKMQIKMDEEKILRENVLNLQKIYSFIDEQFVKRSFIKEKTEDGSLMYRANSPESDFADCGAIYSTFRFLDWFLPNCIVWNLLTDDNGTLSDFEVQDFLTSKYL